MSKIIAFGHKSRVGKDTAVNLLISYINKVRPDLSVKRAAFGDLIKEVSYLIYRCYGLQQRIHYDLYPEKRYIQLPVINMTPVEIWIEVGESFRKKNSLIWINPVLTYELPDILLISDLRFPTELEEIKKHNGSVFKITRTNALNIGSEPDKALDFFTEWDHVINNDTTIEDLEKSLISILNKEGILTWNKKI